jgi:hypothetical protein
MHMLILFINVRGNEVDDVMDTFDLLIKTMK